MFLSSTVFMFTLVMYAKCKPNLLYLGYVIAFKLSTLPYKL